MFKYNELDFQEEILNKFVAKGWKKVNVNDQCIGFSLFKDSFSTFLKNKYNINNLEINKIIWIIDAKLQSNWFENNKIAFLDILKDGISTELTKKQHRPPYMLIDFNNLQKNMFEIAKEVKITNDSRLDLVLFINGLPIFIFELKSVFNDNATLENAFEQLKTYLKIDNPKFATFNIAQIVAKNYATSKIGSIGAPEINMWFNLCGNIKKTNSFFDIFQKARIFKYIKWGILFDKSIKTKKKYILKHHQYEAIIKLHKSIRKKENGYIWHAQGSGKTIIISSLISSFLREDHFGSITTIIDVDRIDLSTNIWTTIKSLDPEHFDNQQISKATSRIRLKTYLANRRHRGVIVATTQKFDNWGNISNRDDIIVISDEAHRTHSNDELNKNTMTYLDKINLALPNSLRYGFTGTPIFETDKSTYAMFGDCIHKYTMKQAEDDKVILPIKMTIIEAPIKLKKEIDNSLFNNKIIRRKKDIIDRSKDRLTFLTDSISKKFTELRNEHNSFGIKDTFKAMIVTNSKAQGFDIFNLLVQKMYEKNDGKIHFIASSINNINSPDKDRTNEKVHKYLRSIEKNKKKWIEEFKDKNSKIEILVVVDMLLTGYDVPNLRLMFLDKNIQKHNLLQAITRVNRIFEQKEHGYIISFRDLRPQLKETLHVYRNTTHDHETHIQTSLNAEKKLSFVINKINEEFNINFRNIDYQEINYKANEIKDEFLENKMFMEYITDIVNFSNLIIKWKNIDNKKISLLCKLILQSKKMNSPTYIDIPYEVFEKLLNATIVDRTLVRKIDYASLDELVKASLPQKSILNKIFQKLQRSISQNNWLLPNQKKTMLEQLQKIIDEYNGDNFNDIFQKFSSFEKDMLKNNNHFSEYTKFLINEATLIIKKELRFITLKKIDKIFIDLDKDWMSNPAYKKRAKLDIKKVILSNEDIVTKQAIIIINNCFDQIKRRGYHGY